MKFPQSQSGTHHPMPGVTQSNLGPVRVLFSFLLLGGLILGGFFWYETSGAGFSFFDDIRVNQDAEELVLLGLSLGIPLIFLVSIIFSVRLAIKRIAQQKKVLENHLHKNSGTMSTQNPIAQTNKPIQTQTPEETIKKAFDQINKVFGNTKKGGNDGTKKKNGIVGWIFLFYIIGSIIVSVIRSVLDAL